jgi:hypothetical protein
MNIPIQETAMLRAGSKCGQTKHQKYGAYIDILRERQDVVPYLLKNIDESSNGEILIKAVDIAQDLGPYFAKLGETEIRIF